MAGWDHSVDFVSVGSGGGGLMAAVTAADAGLDVLVVEKMPLIGGSTAMSGGVLWLPDNPLMGEEGVADSVDAGLTHFDAVVGDMGPASSLERRRTYIESGSEMVSMLRAKGVRFARAQGYSDYYSNLPGGHDDGRSIEPVPFDADEIDDLRDQVMPGIASSIGMVVLTNELRPLQYFNRSMKCFWVAVRVFLRTTLAKARKKKMLTNGSALVANLIKIAQRQGVPIWTEAPLQELVVEDDRVVGVVVLKDGRPFRVQARKGVIVAAGGFGRNAELRRRFSGDQPNDATYSYANPGDTGEALELLMGLGARTDLLDEAWWLPSTLPELAGSTLGQARQRPGAILVNQNGKRFVNEANSMVEVGKAMYADSNGHCWVVTDDLYRSRYANGKQRPGKLPEEWVTNGWVKRDDTLEGLAAQVGVDPAGLAATVAAFNEHAVRGEDPEFGRGASAYNRCMGDPGHKPNPAIGPLAKAPFYAAEIIPADVGTCGGVLTDEFGRVLGDAGPIQGLYATGNVTATVLGRSYLGAGASIASAMVFGYAAARHVAATADDVVDDREAESA